MTQNQIIKAACKLSAKSFLELMDHNGVNYSIFDMDNIMDPNDGYLNVEIDSFPAGEALLFIDGDFSGQ
jgi:hypothetical protein